jgi:predicted TIM-barrel enzyme
VSAIDRTAVLERLRAEVARRRPLLVAGVGTGLTARSAISGGADVVIAYHSAPIRLAGLPSIAGLMPFANANALVREIGPAIVRAAGGHPVLATACAADPATSQPALLAELRGLGFCGVLAAPTATLIDGAFRAELERAGLGFGAEVALVRCAREADLVACAYATDPAEAGALVAAGADVVIAHLGVTHGGTGTRLDLTSPRRPTASAPWRARRPGPRAAPLPRRTAQQPGRAPPGARRMRRHRGLLRRVHPREGPIERTITQTASAFKDCRSR